MRFEDKVLDYEVIQDIGLLEKSQLIIYGTSSSAERFWPVIKNYHVVGCSDGNTSKIGSDFHGYEIEEFKEISRRLVLKEVIVLVLSVYTEDIIEYCLSLSGEIKGFITLFGLQYTCLVNQRRLKLEVKQRGLYKKNWERMLYIEKKRVVNDFRRVYYEKILSFHNSNPILVYTVGKVGSSAIISALKECGGQTLRIEGFSPYLYYIWDDNEMQICRDMIRSIRKDKEKIKIITCVREPIARDFSSLMYVLPEKLWTGGFVLGDVQGVKEDFGDYVNKGFLDNMDSLFSICGYDSDLVSNMTEETKLDILKKRGEKNSIFAFFELELKDFFGIDVFAYPFDKEKGYSIISSGNTECLILKQEKFKELEPVIREFTGFHEFKLKEKNSASQRLSGYVYHKAMKKLAFPKEVLDWYYSNDSMHHFYSEQEILEFRAKWGKCPD